MSAVNYTPAYKYLDLKGWSKFLVFLEKKSKISLTAETSPLFKLSEQTMYV